VNIHVDSEKLRQWCAAHRSELECLLTPVNPKIASSFLEDNVIDLDHAKEVLKMPALDPIIYGLSGTFTNGNPDAILIDGHHRYFLAWVTKHEFIPSYLLKPEQWEPFKIDGLPSLTEEQLRAMPTKAEWQRNRAEAEQRISGVRKQLDEEKKDA
jgi:hypothetical protein